MAITSPYTYGQTQTPDQEQDPNALTANGPSSQQGAYSPPKTETQTTAPSSQPSSSSSSDQQAPQTFSQMQAAGLPRPPIPESPAPSQNGGAPDSAPGMLAKDYATQLALPGTQNSLMPTDNASLQTMPQQTMANPQPTPDQVGTLPGVGVTPITQAGPPPPSGFASWGDYAAATGQNPANLSSWNTYDPNALLNEQAKAEQAAAGGATGLAYGATPTGSTGNPNAGGSVATYGDTSANDAALAAAGRANPILNSLIPAQQQAALASANATTQAGNSANTLAAWQQYVNSQPGQATQGLDPNNPPAWFTGGANPVNGTTTAGGPTNPNYNPNAPVQPNNGAMVNGQYTLPGTTPTYLPPGGVSSSGGTTSSGFTPTNNPTGAPTQAPTQSAPGITQTGQTASTSNAPNSSFDMLNSLTQGAQGQGAGAPLQNATQTAALNYLNNPNPYAQQDVQDQYKYLSGNIDDQYNLQRKQLGEDMARRGLGASTIYGGNLNDLNIGQRTAQESLATDLAHQFATSQSGAQQAAIGLGNQVGTQGQQNQQSWLNQLQGFGQNAFNNDLATNQQNQNATNSYQDYILKLLGMGYSPTG